MSKYFIVKNTIKHGPLSLEQLKELKINKTDLVWKEGNEDWINAEEMPELTELIQSDIPKTPFEKKVGVTKKNIKAYFLIPIIAGLALGLVSIACWSSVKDKIHDFKPNYLNTGSTVETTYSPYMDKYLAGEYGFSALRDNEELYYQNYDQGLFRPIKAIFSTFDSKTQFYVGKNENAPFVSFIFSWILYCTVIYLIIYGIQIATIRARN